MNAHPTEDDFVLYYYGEAEDASEIETHLASCDPCRASLATLRAVLAAVEDVAAPARGEDYGAAVWQRLEPRLARRSWPRRFAPWGALAASLLLAFLLGRYYPAQPTNQALSAPVRERILFVAVGDHLERSQMLLVELSHANPRVPADIGAERDQAEELVGANRVYRQAAARSGEAGVADVLDELERVLVEIAHSPTQLSGPELARIQRRIESKGILFKVRVLGSQVRERENQAVRAIPAAIS
jgi:hypothetical protein